MFLRTLSNRQRIADFVTGNAFCVFFSVRFGDGLRQGNPGNFPKKTPKGANLMEAAFLLGGLKLLTAEPFCLSEKRVSGLSANSAVKDT